jgi:carboxyl-terminal processing protease
MAWEELNTGGPYLKTMFKGKRLWVGALVLSLLMSLVLVNFWANRDAKAGEDYSELKVFTEALSAVKSNYVEEPNTKDLIYGAIKGMISSLDPHSGFMPPDSYKEMQVDTKGEFGGLGIQIGLKDDMLTVISPMEDTPAYKAGILAGDRILSIDGETTKDMSLFDAVKKMRGPKGTKVVLGILRQGWTATKDFTITRDIIIVKSVKYKMIDPAARIGYIKLIQFQEKSGADMALALKELNKEGMRALIFDLRNNPGGLLTSSVEVASQFLPQGKLVVYIKGRTGGRTEYRSFGQFPSYDEIPIICLINQGSASASEIVAGALKDWQRAVILGTQSFGKGSVQSVIPLSDGSGLRLTTARYYTPKGISIQNTGITPDIEVKLASENVKGGKQHVIFREKDLKNHLDAKPSEKENTIDENKETEDVSAFAPLKEEDDTQLQRALDLIKSWNVFKGIANATAG